VNHTVDTDVDEDIDSHQQNAEIGEMRSKPSFTVDIVKGNKTLSFSCSFNSQPGASGDENYSMFIPFFSRLLIKLR